MDKLLDRASDGVMLVLKVVGLRHGSGWLTKRVHGVKDLVAGPYAWRVLFVCPAG